MVRGIPTKSSSRISDMTVQWIVQKNGKRDTKTITEAVKLYFEFDTRKSFGGVNIFSV